MIIAGWQKSRTDDSTGEGHAPAPARPVFRRALASIVPAKAVAKAAWANVVPARAIAARAVAAIAGRLSVCLGRLGRGATGLPGVALDPAFHDPGPYGPESALGKPQKPGAPRKPGDPRKPYGPRKSVTPRAPAPSGLRGPQARRAAAWRTAVLGLLALGGLAAGGPAVALDAESLAALTAGGTAAKLAAIKERVAAADVAATPVLRALEAGELHADADGRAFIVRGERVLDPLTGEPAAAAPDAAGLDKITINNRVRRALDAAVAALELAAPDPALRLAAAEAVRARADPEALPLLDTALARERDAGIRAVLEQARAGVLLTAADAAQRLRAAEVLGGSDRQAVRSALAARLEANAAGNPAEPDARVRAQIKTSLAAIDARLAWGDWLGRVFSGLSLGSILLLAALGLAVTYGLMGVINMAHGELLMIGAYATFAVQSLFRTYWPGALDWYLPAALPAAFAASMLVGMAMERTVIRHLYGRPLETLLATWGISLVLIQLVRTLFGPQNVEVANPAWMSGGVRVLSNLTLPYNRIAIIVFAALVLATVWFLLNHTRLGLFVRGVTQNRGMASALGVPTGRVDVWTFGLGSGVAGLGGAALSQVGNVGPELGQGYIVDSFMVVVLGGVGQLAGTVAGALGLGVLNKFLEPYAGAVLAKIMVLVLIILFIQKRPQGLFVLKGRTVEA